MNNPKSSKQNAILLTLVFNILFFLSLFFIIAWKETIPPIPEYGIELGFTDFQENIENKSEEDNENQVEENSENEGERSEENNNELDNLEVREEVIENDKNIFDIENINQKEVESFDDLPINEEKTIPDENSNPNEINVDKKSTDEKISTRKVIDSRSIYTESSTSNSGASLDLQGWIWNSLPEPKDLSKENGKIIFEIFVDFYGEIINIKTIETTVNPSVEKIYRDEVLKLTFNPLSTNYNPADISKGTITFIIKSK